MVGAVGASLEGCNFRRPWVQDLIQKSSKALEDLTVPEIFARSESRAFIMFSCWLRITSPKTREEKYVRFITN